MQGPDCRLYVLGGGPDGSNCFSSMEVLDVRMKSWDATMRQCQYSRHYNAAAFAPDGCLYVAGAYRHPPVGQLDVVERYHPRADRWETLPFMGVPITFSSGIVSF